MEIGRDSGGSVSLLEPEICPLKYFRDNSRMLSTTPARARYRKTLLSVLLAFISFTLGLTVEAQRQEGIHGLTLWIDNIVAALLLGIVVFAYERRRGKELIRKLEVIARMNHHVRNALHQVMYLPYSKDQEQQLSTIRDAVQRIDWALREILPGSKQKEDLGPKAA